MDTNSRIVGAFAAAAAMASVSSQGLAQTLKEDEKGYGVVKAGGNDCASFSKPNSWRETAKVQNRKSEWLLLPSGTCERLVSGELVDA